MIVYDFPQGSDPWKQARLGVVTASGLDRILTGKTLKPSAQQDAYLHQLVAEMVIGAPLDDASSEFMERGVQMEGEAADFYAYSRGSTLSTVGFITRDDGRVGCSPDRLVGDDGLLEIKCPAAHTHVSYVINPDALVTAYRAQVQGQMLVTGRKWVDLMAFNPAMSEVVVRVEPDKKYLDALVPELESFLKRLDEALAKVRPVTSENPFA